MARDYFNSVFKIEQPAELNRFVDRSIPLTWEYRREQLGLAMPLIVPLILLWVLLVMARLWVDEAWERLPAVLGAFAAMPVVLMGLLEFGIRARQRAKRVLELREKKVVFGEKRNWVKWEQVRAFRFEPLEGEPELQKLTMVYQFPKNTQERSWSLVVSSRGLLTQVTRELRRIKAEQATRFEIEFLEDARAAVKKLKVPVPWLFGWAFLLFVVGIPLLAVGLMPREEKKERPLEEARNYSPARDQKIAKLIGNRFGSVEELRLFFILMGGGLMAVAILLVKVETRRLEEWKRRNTPLPQPEPLGRI